MTTRKRLTAKELMDLPKAERYKLLADQAANPEIITYYKSIIGENELPVPGFCRHCGSRTALLITNPDTGFVACLPCIRTKEPEVYRDICNFTRDYPPVSE